MPMPAEIIKRGVKLEAIEGSQAVQKHTNSRRRLLYRLLGGRLVLGPKPIIRYPRELVKFPVLWVVAETNCLWKALGPWA